MRFTIFGYRKGSGGQGVGRGGQGGRGYDGFGKWRGARVDVSVFTRGIRRFPISNLFLTSKMQFHYHAYEIILFFITFTAIIIWLILWQPLLLRY